MERSIAALFMGAGMAAGGFIGALVGGASGALLGGYLGARAGTDTIDSINLSLVKKYRQESVKQFVKLEHVTGDLGYRCHDRINRLTGSSMAANLLGGAVGTFWGALKGMIGGAVAVGSEASGYMGLWARNRVTEKMDSLPPHYRTRQIIGRDYQNAPFSGTRM
jgi:outer membrane lipoprotein SlyB